MPRLLAALALPAALLLALPVPVRAGGAREPAPAPGPLTVYLVLEPAESRNGMLVERMHLPSSLAAMSWTRYRLQGSGNVELEAGGGFRLLSHQPVSEQSLGELGVYGYALRVSRTAGAQQEPRRTFSLSFAYDGSGGGVVLQPAQRALLEGIRRGGRQSGYARVLELAYLGQGRFRARVGVR